jgi:hypothetical protein
MMLVTLANQQSSLDNEVATLEETLKLKQAQLRELSENQIREARESFLDEQRDLEEKIGTLQSDLADVMADLDRFELENGEAPESVVEKWQRAIEEEPASPDRALWDSILAEAEGLVEEWRTILSKRDRLQDAIATFKSRQLPYDDDSITLPDGRKLTFKQEIYLGIPKDDLEKRAGCFGHLKEIGAENLCTHRFTVDFPKGAEVEAQRFAAQLQRLFPEHDVQVTGIPDISDLKTAVKLLFEQFPMAKHYMEWTVNAQTLKAWARKRIKAGYTIPDEFGLYAPVRVTVSDVE